MTQGNTSTSTSQSRKVSARNKDTSPATSKELALRLEDDEELREQFDEWLQGGF